ncbi:class I SAM-dependent methyltransferase [Chitinophaga filiformis]|uniref:class I SAM-dependent methyltransferase n=1 Tax=Chitinophaga filiformis TaxID=104663 RepID=UPI001F3CAE0F|nr:class I SAM-dependent methyltransferase [Chitinophaga filiformis]MCF6403832.1 class I SAM-dependent methyltransferase [Chitinophaga filiformis]
MEKPAMTAGEVASQLRRPEGEDGIKVGFAMNKSNAALYQMVLDFLAIKPGDRILEIGFGNGHFIPALFERENAIRYTGLDMSETMVTQATRENEARISDGSVTLQLGKTEDMPFAAGAFTKVFAVNVLYFWDEPVVALKAIHRVLDTGGQLLLGIRSKETMQQLPFSAHGFTLYSAEEAKALLEANGFRDIEVQTRMEAPRMSGDGSTMVELENICLRGIKF